MCTSNSLETCLLRFANKLLTILIDIFVEKSPSVKLTDQELSYIYQFNSHLFADRFSREMETIKKSLSLWISPSHPRWLSRKGRGKRGVKSLPESRECGVKEGRGRKSERDDREASRGCYPYRGTLWGEVSQTGGGSGQRGEGEGESNVKSTAQSCRRGAILRAKGRRLPDVWKGSRAIIEGKKGLCGFIGAAPRHRGDDLIDCFSRSG